MKNKRKLGQFYTIEDAFDNEPFKQWFPKALKQSRNKVLEPFAGSNNIISLLLKMYKFDFTSYDIEPNHKDVKKRDTLKNYPKNYNLAITNPPYLSKVSAVRRKIKINFYGHADLYLLSLSKMLKNNDYVAAIIPTSFIRKNLYANRLDYFIFLSKPMFSDTETPVALALFSPIKEAKNIIYDLNKKIDTIKNIKSWIFKRYSSSKIHTIKFNTENGELGLRALDSTGDERIRFCHANELKQYKMKISSRNISKIEIPFKLNNEIIEKINKELYIYRTKTSDVFLNAFMGLRKDGHYRRRLDYKMARKIIERVINENKL